MPSNRSFIINSLLDLDIYKLFMGQFIFHRFPNVPVRFGFTNRTKSVNLGDKIDEKELRTQLDHVRTLRVEKAELEFLSGVKNDSKVIFTPGYLDFLKNLQLPEYELSYTGGDLHLQFPGVWSKNTYWETIALSIVNELYYRYFTDRLQFHEEQDVYEDGMNRLLTKISMIRRSGHIVFSDFGTRRRFSFAWHDRVLETLANAGLGGQFLGTSNVYFAMKHKLTPIGTNAHELPMVLAGIMQDTEEDLYHSPLELLRQWFDEYGHGMSIVLPDTFGSEHIFKNMCKEQALAWKGFRHDSGDPIVFGERVIRFYDACDINPRGKMIIFSDGLDLATMLKIIDHFKGRIQVVFGWGTNLTNDLGFMTLSLVVKAIEAMGRRLVKMSDNIAKATGPTDEIERYKRIFQYQNTFSEMPIR